jgi:diketogulonate reductase-like aldo/keto reductase
MQLNNGIHMPLLGFGVFQVSDATLDTGASLFFDHRDPAMVKWLSEAQRPT